MLNGNKSGDISDVIIIGTSYTVEYIIVEAKEKHMDDRSI